MFNLLHGAGWTQDGGHVEILDNCLSLSFSHEEIPEIALSLQVCLDELPAVTIVSLLDSNGIVDQEWQDDEIDVDEITEAARDAYQEMIDMLDDDNN